LKTVTGSQTLAVNWSTPPSDEIWRALCSAPGRTSAQHVIVRWSRLMTAPPVMT
jgi:hypothetical protein